MTTLASHPLEPVLFEIAHFIVFASGTGLLALLILLLFVALSNLYSPEGRGIDPSHIWVNTRTGRKHRDATVRDVYEKRHGRGAWLSKVRRERSVLIISGFVISLMVSITALIYATNHLSVVVMSQMIARWGITVTIVVGCILGLYGCISIIPAGFVFWDIAGSIPSTDTNMELMSRYESPSLFSVILRALLLLSRVIWGAFILVYSWLPAIHSGGFENVFPKTVIAFYLGSAMYWFWGAFTPKPKPTAEYVEKQQRQKQREAIPELFQELHSDEYSKAERVMRGVCILASDQVNAKGRRATVQQLERITGEKYGDDVDRWCDWLKANS